MADGTAEASQGGRTARCFVRRLAGDRQWSDVISVVEDEDEERGGGEGTSTLKMRAMASIFTGKGIPVAMATSFT